MEILDCYVTSLQLCLWQLFCLRQCFPPLPPANSGPWTLLVGYPSQDHQEFIQFGQGPSPFNLELIFVINSVFCTEESVLASVQTQKLPSFHPSHYHICSIFAFGLSFETSPLFGISPTLGVCAAQYACVLQHAFQGYLAAVCVPV